MTAQWLCDKAALKLYEPVKFQTSYWKNAPNGEYFKATQLYNCYTEIQIISRQIRGETRKRSGKEERIKKQERQMKKEN